MKCHQFAYPILLCNLLIPSANAFIIDSSVTPWTTTASGDRSGNGAPGTLTWSIVPDGTRVSDGSESLGRSNLLEFLNENFDGDPSETDHTLQPWFPLLETSFNRWSELSGLSFVYEDNDDGGSHRSRRGILGVRGDIRIAGAPIDGSGNTLAFNFLPEFGGDMVLDTDETSFNDSSDDFLFFRDTVMHELGHAIGLSHVISNTDRLLMEPFTDISIDGPQLDEVRGIQYYFGDAFESAGNNTVTFASHLGELAVGGSLSVGGDGNVSSQAVKADAIDFVSISNGNDLDFYAFRVMDHAVLSAELTPLGGTFSQAGEFERPRSFDASARSDLALTVFDTDGASVLGFVDETEAGENELLDSIRLAPGTYFARVEGDEEDAIQLYSLAFGLSALPADCNGDGTVDARDLDCACAIGLTALLTELDSVVGDLDVDGAVAFADFLMLSRHFGTSGGYAEGDLNCDGEVAFADFLILADGFGTAETNVAGVPEPRPFAAMLIGVLLSGIRFRRRQRA